MEATQALLDKVSHPELGKNKNTIQEPNITKPRNKNKHLEQSPREGKSSQKSSQKPRPLMC